MILKFKNAHIFFAVESIWGNLNYKFKYLLNKVITENSENDFVQTIEIPIDVLLQIFSTVTVQAEGVASFINQEMLESLMPQIMGQSNIAAALKGTEEPNESALLLFAIADIDNANKTIKAAKIISGKNQILA